MSECVEGRQGVHHAPCTAASPAPATPNRSTEARRPRDARGGGQGTSEGAPATPNRSTEARRPRDARGTPEGRQGVHHAPCRAASPAEGRQRDARAYIMPLAEQQVPRLPRQIEAQRRGGQGTPEGRQRDARAYITPLQSSKSRACHAK